MIDFTIGIKMSASILTEDIAVEALRNFFREKPFLFFGTGMSCAIDTRFGMGALKDALIANRSEEISQLDDEINDLLFELD